MKQVEIFRCVDCALEVALIPPVTRPCPSCGGDFANLSIFDNRDERNLYTPMINKIVNDNFDNIVNELEGYLAEADK